MIQEYIDDHNTGNKYGSSQRDDGLVWKIAIQNVCEFIDFPTSQKSSTELS